MNRYAFVAVVALGAVAAPAGAAGRAEPDPLTPADAEVVMRLNVRQALQAPLVKKHALDPLRVLVRRDDEVQRLLRAAGIDPLRDVDTVGVSTSGNPLAGGKLLVVVRGKFDPDKARSAAEEYTKKHPDRLKAVKEGDLPMWEVASEHRSLFAAFAGSGAVVLTPTKADTAAAVRRAGEAPARPSPGLRAALDQVNGGEAAWLAMVATDDIKELLKGDDNTRDLADTLRSVTGGLELGDDARLTLVAHTSSAEAARKLKGKIDEVMPLLLFLGAGKDKGGQVAKEVINNIKLATDKNDVSVRLQITDAQLDKVRKKAP